MRYRHEKDRFGLDVRDRVKSTDGKSACTSSLIIRCLDGGLYFC